MASRQKPVARRTATSAPTGHSAPQADEASAAPTRLAFPAVGGFVEARSPLSVQVSRRLRQAIVGGGVEAGTELPSEKELGRDLGVGRSTVREAVRILKAQGLVSGGDEVSTKRARVANDRELSAAASQAMENVMLLGRVPIHDLVELRVVLEGAVVEAAASRAKSADASAGFVAAIEAAEEALAEMADDTADVTRFRAADLAFHLALAHAAGNAAYPLIMGVLRSAIAAHLGEALEHVADFSSTANSLVDEHRAILDAVRRARPSRARALVAAHVRDFYADAHADADAPRAAAAPRGKRATAPRASSRRAR